VCPGSKIHLAIVEFPDKKTRLPKEVYTTVEAADAMTEEKGRGYFYPHRLDIINGPKGIDE